MTILYVLAAAALVAGCSDFKADGASRPSRPLLAGTGDSVPAATSPAFHLA